MGWCAAFFDQDAVAGVAAVALRDPVVEQIPVIAVRLLVFDRDRRKNPESLRVEPFCLRRRLRGSIDAGRRRRPVRDRRTDRREPLPARRRRRAATSRLGIACSPRRRAALSRIDLEEARDVAWSESWWTVSRAHAMRGARRAECRLSAVRAAHRLHSGAERIVRAAHHIAETGSVPPVLRHAHSRWTPTMLTIRDNVTGQHRSATQSRTSRLRRV